MKPETGSDGNKTPNRFLEEPRRKLLFHISACLDVNEFELEIIDRWHLSRKKFKKCFSFEQI